MNRFARAAVAATVILSIVATASPAAAVELPDGDRLIVLPCNETAVDGDAYEYNPDSFETSVIGDDTDVNEVGCARQGAYDAHSGMVYWLEWSPEGIRLVVLDPDSGLNRVVGFVSLAGDPVNATGIAIDDSGHAFVTIYEPVHTLYAVDLSSGALTPVGLTGLGDGMVNCVYAFAFDPVTKKFYAYTATGHDLYTVDTSTGAFTLVEEDVFPRQIWSISFDSAGNLWGANEQIYTAAPDDLHTLEERALIGDLLVWSIVAIRASGVDEAPAPQLAETGIDGGTAGMLAGSALLMMIGGLLVARRRDASA